MKSFTAHSDEWFTAIIQAQRNTGEKYPMELNAGDFQTIARALRHYGSERADSLLSSIGETLGIEGI